LHNGNTKLSDAVILGLGRGSGEIKEINMLKKIYRAMVLAQASTAANRTAAYLTDHQLQDWGYTRGSFAAVMVAKFKADFDTADQAKAAYQPVTFSEFPA
jgi:hypothetical protein